MFPVFSGSLPGLPCLMCTLSYFAGVRSILLAVSQKGSSVFLQGKTFFVVAYICYFIFNKKNSLNLLPPFTRNPYLLLSSSSCTVFQAFGSKFIFNPQKALCMRTTASFRGANSNRSHWSWKPLKSTTCKKQTSNSEPLGRWKSARHRRFALVQQTRSTLSGFPSQ